MVDQIIQGKTRTKRLYSSYYTESDPILSYMVSKLDINKNDLVLEPSAGDGVFIEKILSSDKGEKLSIEAVDLNSDAVTNLKNKFKQNGNVTIRETDTLLDVTFDLFSNSGGYYTKVIGNPPYGAWQDYQKRNVLKKIYGGYVRETYTLFIRRGIDLLKENGKLVFIIPDTYLALHLHKDLRKKLLTETRIEEILLIPSSFFPGVNFGYSNLSIITLQKNKNIKNNNLKIIKVENSVDSLYELSKGNYEAADDYQEISQDEILGSVDHSFFIGADKKLRTMINGHNNTLGDIADCVTGFYSGDNGQFLAVIDDSVKGSKKYKKVNKSSINEQYLEENNILSGLKNGKHYVPILKGSGGIVKKPTQWFVKWDEETVEFYKKDKKARFQNSKYYFRDGIGVPMVKTSKFHAFLLEKRLFDQSVVGIFPRDKSLINYLIAFLNSSTCNTIIKSINHTVNNSANYLKKIPIIINDEIINDMNRIVETYKQTEDPALLLQVDQTFNRLYQFN